MLAASIAWTLAEMLKPNIVFTASLSPLVEDARWWNEWVIQMEEAETLAKATSTHGAKSLKWSSGSRPVQHPEQQPGRWETFVITDSWKWNNSSSLSKYDVPSNSQLSVLLLPHIDLFCKIKYTSKSNKENWSYTSCE